VDLKSYEVTSLEGLAQNLGYLNETYLNDSYQMLNPDQGRSAKLCRLGRAATIYIRQELSLCMSNNILKSRIIRAWMEKREEQTV
jgi:hypothetical protein